MELNSKFLVLQYGQSRQVRLLESLSTELLMLPWNLTAEVCRKPVFTSLPLMKVFAYGFLTKDLKRYIDGIWSDDETHFRYTGYYIIYGSNYIN